jgi:hypothetical protein
MCVALAVTMGAVARADDVTDQIDEGVKAYAKHDYPTATAALDAASKLIRQKRGEALTKLLPDAPPGWTAAEAEHTSVGAEMLGGGTNVSRRYTKGDSSVEISVTTDSPIVSGMGALLGNAMFTSSDNKLVVIDGRKTTYTKSDNSYQAMVGKALVKVEASKDVDDDTLKGFYKSIRLDDIEKGDY